MKSILAPVAVLSLMASTAMALETVYVTARPQGCTVTANCPGPNLDGTYSEHFPSLGDYGAVGSAQGHPQTTVARTYISGTSITDTGAGVTLTPTLAVAGGTYLIEYNFNSTAGNTSTDVVFSVTSPNANLSFTTTDKMQRSYGTPANRWNVVGYLTNQVGVTKPELTFNYASGMINGTLQNRLLLDCWKFTYVDVCMKTPAVAAVGPLGASMNEVNVTGVATNATKITIYQDNGAGMVAIGSKTTGIVPGANKVSVTGLVKNAAVAATQTVANQEGCVPAAGVRVGGGANPPIRIALTIRETTNATAKAGSPGNTASGNLHFLGASAVSGGAPIDAAIVYPSNGWQTVSISRGSVSIGTTANVTGIPTNLPSGFTGYVADFGMDIQVYAFRKGTNSASVVTNIFSRVPAQSASVVSNQAYGVVWKWDAVPNAEGYRVVRSWGGTPAYEGADVTNNVFVDYNVADQWLAGIDVNTNGIQNGLSVQWNPSVSNTNNLPGQWGTLESINFAIADLTDTGPFDVYIDNVQNGTNVFQTFEEAPAGMTAYGFQPPFYSGTSSGNLLNPPDVGQVVNTVADTGMKSLHLVWQWNALSASRWIRLTTSSTYPASNPFVNLDEPISFRILIQPVGATLPAAPARPALTAAQANGQTVLIWTGAHRLQSSGDVSGTYTNVPQIMLLHNTYSAADLHPGTNTFLAPYTNLFTEPARFFRLVD